MNIAKPPAGFRIQIEQAVHHLIQGSGDGFRRHFEMIVERLKHTGHREGEPLPNHGRRGARVFKARGTIDGRLPTITVVYTVVGDTLTVFNAG